MKSIALTDVGARRAQNQDSIFYSDCPIGALPNLYIVADGMGGELAGDYASKACVEAVIEQVARSAESSPIKALEAAIQEANSLIYHEARRDPGKNGMGTTFVAATIIDDHLFVANVGDSRLYVANKSKLTQITNDHSLVAELVRSGVLAADEAQKDSRKNKITRAIGVEPQVAVDYFDVTLTGSELILLCSDGLTNMVDDKEIFSILTSSDNIDNKAARLIEMANNNGGKDNISTIVIEVEQ